MSVQTLRDLEAAIQAHYDAELLEQPGKKRGMIIDWVVGFTVHSMVEMEDTDGVERSLSGYANWYVSADTNPNGQAHLAQWVSDELSSVLVYEDDE